MVTWSLSLWHVVHRHVILSEGIKVVFLPSCTLSSLVNSATIELPPLFGLYLFPSTLVTIVGSRIRALSPYIPTPYKHHTLLLQCRRRYTSTLLFDLTMILPYGDPTILQHTS